MTVLVTGHRGLVGTALMRLLGPSEPVGVSSAEIDLRDRAEVFALFDRLRPRQVYHAATRSGGILANTTRSAEFLSDNLRIQVNLLDAANTFDVDRFIYIATSRVYPIDAPQPVAEEQLLSGPVQPGLEAYAVGKIAGILQTQAMRKQFGRRYISVVPCNLYGPNDHFNSPAAHVIPMVMQRMHQAKLNGDKEFTIYGSGRPKREFLHVDDMARACIHLMAHYDDDMPVNLGTGEEVSIDALTRRIAEVVGFPDSFTHDTSKPDGVAGQVLDCSRALATGWKPQISLAEGLAGTYAWYLAQAA